MKQNNEEVKKNMEFLAPIIVFIKRLINDTIKKPSTDGTSGQVLATDGAGGTYWKDGGGGGGLPSVTGDGKALVSINGQWTEQEGYGYASEPTQMVWDDNFEDRERISIDFPQGLTSSGYFISDITIPRETMKYSTLGMRFEDDTEYDECLLNRIYDYNEDAYIAIGSEIHDLIVVLKDTVIEGSYIRKGIYCPKVSSIKYYRLTIPSIVHQIDEKYIPSGSGLPDPSSLANGTAFVAVNGEWTEQEGYGYVIEQPELITWDGNTDGKYISLDNEWCRVADAIDITNPEGLRYSLTTWDEEHYEDLPYDGIEGVFGNQVYTIFFYDTETGGYGEIRVAPEDVYADPDDPNDSQLLYQKGTYFMIDSTDCSLTIPTSVHQIDEKYIPDVSPVFIADYEVSSFEEVVDAIKAGKAIFCRLPSVDTGDQFSNSIIPLRSEYHEELADGEKIYQSFEFVMFDYTDDNERCCFIFAILNEDGWQFEQDPITADFIDINGEILSDKIADIEDQIGDSITALDGINDGLEGLV